MNSALLLRSWAFQHLRLRPGLPRLRDFSAETPEARFYQLVLKRTLSTASLSEASRWVDVGCRNWSYLPGVLTLLPRLEQAWGIELDPGRLYWNGYYRGDAARAAAQACTQENRRVHFLPGDFSSLPLERYELDARRTHRGTPLLVTHFFPFVSEHPCKSWGLPPRFADFRPLIARTQALASELGASRLDWLSLHQGEWEAAIARTLWAEAGFKIHEGVITPDEFGALWPGQHSVVWMTGSSDSRQSLGAL